MTDLVQDDVLRSDRQGGLRTAASASLELVLFTDTFFWRTCRPLEEELGERDKLRLGGVGNKAMSSSEGWLINAQRRMKDVSKRLSLKARRDCGNVNTYQ